MTIAGVCRIVSRVLHNEHLVDLCFDFEPSSCVHHDAWQREGLPELSDDMAHLGWSDVLPLIRREKVRCCLHAQPQLPRHAPCTRCTMCSGGAACATLKRILRSMASLPCCCAPLPPAPSFPPAAYMRIVHFCVASRILARNF